MTSRYIGQINAKYNSTDIIITPDRAAADQDGAPIVNTTGAQTISGAKTFSGSTTFTGKVTASNTGNSLKVANHDSVLTSNDVLSAKDINTPNGDGNILVHRSGDENISGIKNFLAMGPMVPSANFAGGYYGYWYEALRFQIPSLYPSRALQIVCKIINCDAHLVTDCFIWIVADISSSLSSGIKVSTNPSYICLTRNADGSFSLWLRYRYSTVLIDWVCDPYSVNTPMLKSNVVMDDVLHPAVSATTVKPVVGDEFIAVYDAVLMERE